MRLICETLQTKEKSLPTEQTTLKHALKTAKSGNTITFDQEITIERSIKLGKADGALKEVDNMLTTTAKLDNNANNENFKQLDKALQNRRKILEARKITSGWWLNRSNSGATTTQMDRIINRSLDLGSTEGHSKR